MQIDWLRGTILNRPIDDVLSALLPILGERQELDRGGSGYEYSAIVLGTGRVLWSRLRPDMGVHVNLPASALAACKFDSFNLLQKLQAMEMSFTRIDFTFDDMIRILDIKTVYQVLNSKNFVSRWHKWKNVESHDEDEVGQTIYVGNRASASFLRIYDKAAEQREKGYPFEGHWIRVELELHKERAQLAIKTLLQIDPSTWGERVAEWLLGLIDFKAVGTDSNKSRWQTVGWWHEFLGFVKKSRLTTEKNFRTVDDVRDWVGKQVTPSLLVLWTVDGARRMQNMIDGAASRLKGHHLAMIDLAVQAREGLSVNNEKSRSSSNQI